MMYLKVIAGPQSGYTVELNFPEGANLIIGRQPPKGGLEVVDNKVSKQHAEVFKKENNYFVRDLNSTNGTYVDGKKLSFEQPLKVGMLVKVGTTIMEVVTSSDALGQDGGPIPMAEPLSVDEAASQTAEIRLDLPADPEAEGAQPPFGPTGLSEEAHHKEHPEQPLGKEVASRILPVLHQVSRLVVAEKDVQHLLDHVLKQTIKATDADRGYVVMIDRKSEKFTSHIVYPKNPDPKGRDAESLNVSHTIIKYVTQYTRPLMTSDAMLDKRLGPSSSIAGGVIKSVICVPLITTATHYGVIYLETSKLETPFGQAELELASAIAILAGMGIVTISSHERTERIMMGTLRTLLNIIEIKYPMMEGHSERVANISVNVARQMNLSNTEIRRVQLAGLLHDVGRIMDEPGASGRTNIQFIDAHIRAAEKLLSPIPDLHDILPAIKYHHERIDGNGLYKLTGKDIPLIAKIIAVANEIDNLMTMGDLKGQGLTVTDAVAEIEERAGKQFDADVVNALITCYKNESLFRTGVAGFKPIM